MSIQHQHGGDIIAIKAIGHQTYKRVADWFFLCDVDWYDGSKSRDIQVAPFALCCDPNVASDAERIHQLIAALNDYLERVGTWHDAKHTRDGRVYRWTPKQPEGSQML